MKERLILISRVAKDTLVIYLVRSGPYYCTFYCSQ